MSDCGFWGNDRPGKAAQRAERGGECPQFIECPQPAISHILKWKGGELSAKIFELTIDSVL